MPLGPVRGKLRVPVLQINATQTRFSKELRVSAASILSTLNLFTPQTFSTPRHTHSHHQTPPIPSYLHPKKPPKMADSPSERTPPEYTLPGPPLRQTLSTRLKALADAITAHPQMQPPHRHPTLYHTWDFAMRTHYILSELDNILAGRPIQHPAQVPDYEGPPAGGSGEFIPP